MISTFAYGRISSDIDMQYRNDKAVATFSIAIQKRDKSADFFRFVAFGTTAENIEKYFHKGSRIVVRATPNQPKTYTNKDGKKVYPNVDFIVNEFDFVDTKAESQSSMPEKEADPKQDEFMDVSEEAIEDLPFQ